MYYIISLKHTSIADSAFTLWRAGSSGYCWRQDWAGIYPDADHVRADDQNVFVDTEAADKLFVDAEYDGVQMLVLPNNANVINALGLDVKQLKPKWQRTCYMRLPGGE